MESRVRYEGKSVEMDLIRHSTQFEYYIKLPDAFGLAPYPVSRAGTGTTSPRAKAGTTSPRAKTGTTSPRAKTGTTSLERKRLRYHSLFGMDCLSVERHSLAAGSQRVDNAQRQSLEGAGLVELQCHGQFGLDQEKAA